MIQDDSYSKYSYPKYTAYYWISKAMLRERKVLTSAPLGPCGPLGPGGPGGPCIKKTIWYIKKKRGKINSSLLLFAS